MKKTIGKAFASIACGAFLVPCLFMPLRALPVHAQLCDGADPAALLLSLPAFEGVDVQHEYRPMRALDVAYGTVYRFRRVRDGKEVLGEDVAVAVNRQKEVLSYSGKYQEKAPPALQNGGISNFCTRADLVDYDGNVIPSDIDFKASAVSPKFGTYYLADYERNIVAYTDWGSKTIYSSGFEDGFDKMAVSVFTNIVKAYDFYTVENVGADIRGINGGNDDVWGNADARAEEIPIYVYPHYNVSGNRQNASFGYDEEVKTAYIVVGDGDETGALFEQGKALDILAHEYQHGITMFTADLGHENHAGAINEAVSDIFGALVEGHEPTEDAFWEMGERGVPAGAPVVRSMKDPAEGYATTVSDAYPECHLEGGHSSHGNCDAGGVHFNSTIVSNVQYRLSKRMPAYFTRERIGKLWYATLCMLQSDADFDDFGREFLQAACNLGYSYEAQTAIREELTAGGLLAEEDEFYTVTYCDTDGTVLSETLARAGAPLPLAAPAAREGFAFEGWYLDAACTQKAEGTLAGDTALYAKWTALSAGGDGPNEGDNPGEGDPSEGEKPADGDQDKGKKPFPAWAIGVICGASVAGMGAAVFVIWFVKKKKSKK